MNTITIDEAQFNRLLDAVNITNLEYLILATALLILLYIVYTQSRVVGLLSRAEKLKLMPLFVLVEHGFNNNSEPQEPLYVIKATNNVAYNTHFATVSPLPFFKEDVENIKYDITDVNMVRIIPHVGAMETIDRVTRSKEEHAVLLIWFEDFFSNKYYQQVFLKEGSLRISKPIPEVRW